MSTLTWWHSYANWPIVPGDIWYVWKWSSYINSFKSYCITAGKCMHLVRQWSLPVTWQRWWSHHLTHHRQKPHATHANMIDIFYRTRFIGNWSLHCGNKHFERFRLLWPWPSCMNTNLTCIAWRYTGYANINFLHQGFQKLSSERQTDRISQDYKPCRFVGGQQCHHHHACRRGSSFRRTRRSPPP